MQFVRTAVWVLIAVALALFAWTNWQVVTVRIWEGLVVETKLPALLLVSFLAGLLPMWLYHRAARWRLQRRITLLENTVRAAESAVPPLPSAAAPLTALPPTLPAAADPLHTD
jgi:uncharacterized integral membrane protein